MASAWDLGIDRVLLRTLSSSTSLMRERWVWWAKRDLRVHDNAVLRHLVDSDHECMVLFVLEPSLGEAHETSALHALAQRDALIELKTQIESLGGNLRFAEGEMVDVLESLFISTPFTGIVSHEETGTDVTYKRDKAVARWAIKNDVPWLEFPQNGVVRGLKNRDERQSIIWQRIWDTPIQRAPRKMIPWTLEPSEKLRIDKLLRGDIPDAKRFCEWARANTAKLTVNMQQHVLLGRQQVNETQARAELKDFLNNRGLGYSGGISSPNRAFTSGSRLSTHLAWGTLSLRTAFHETMDRMGHLKKDKSPEAILWKKSLRGFQARLHWHDHFIQRLESAPSMEFTALNPAYANVEYLFDGDEYQARLAAWREGRTGIPMVDACMRCLMTTGFLNFRMRAMLTTTACFGLQLHWKDLLYPLAQVFADYEPGIHISQIQMQAGMVGINTLRVYSPHKQLIDQDPDTLFVRRWIPELAGYSAKEIFAYETEVLGDYCQPITDIKANANVIKDQLYRIRRSIEGKEASKKVLALHGSRLSPNDRNGNASGIRSRKVTKKRDNSDKPNSQFSFDW